MSDRLASGGSSAELLRLALAVALLLAEAAIAVAALFPRVDADYRAFFIDRTRASWPYCATAAQHLSLPNPIEIGTLDPRSACAVLADGWSIPEPWGRWNDGEVAHLALPYLPGEHGVAMTLRAHAPPDRGQAVAILVDGREAGRFAIPSAPDTTIVVPLPPTDHPAVATITLRVPAAYSPLQAGESADPRRLGVGLVRLEWR